MHSMWYAEQVTGTTAQQCIHIAAEVCGYCISEIVLYMQLHRILFGTGVLFISKYLDLCAAGILCALCLKIVRYLLF